MAREKPPRSLRLRSATGKRAKSLRRSRGGGRERRGRRGGAMADSGSPPSWPKADERRLIGQRVSRLDGPAKVTGTAKYTYDVNRPGLLHARVLRCPFAHAKVTRLD